MSAPMAIDQSLDTVSIECRCTHNPVSTETLYQIIKSNRAAKRSSKPKASKIDKKKTSSVSKARKASATGKVKATTAAPSTVATPAAPISNKIIVSNLPPDVKEPEFKELFSKTIGPVKEAALNFDSKGKSKGVGSVVFQKKEDAAKAVKTYHNRLIDGSAYHSLPYRVSI